MGSLIFILTYLSTIWKFLNLISLAQLESLWRQIRIRRNEPTVKGTIVFDANQSITISPVNFDGLPKCYICLAEYEEGDKIRVLPCHHEYHMLCVDKWLKEIHGVCPLCRGDVCEGC